MTDPIAVSKRAREAYLSLNMLPEFDAADVRAGRWDKTTGLQAFAIFEAETRKDEMERVIDLIRTQFDAPHNAGLCGRIIDAINNQSQAITD